MAIDMDAAHPPRQTDTALLQLLGSDSSSQDAILIVGPGGQVLAINEGAENLYGWQPEKLIGQALETIITRGGTPTSQLLDRCLRGERVRNIPAMRRTPNGDIYPIALTLSTLADRDGQTVGVAVIVRDVGQLRQQLARQTRLITVGELTAGLAHELNQPLAAIAHYCDAALSISRADAEVDPELVDALQEAYNQTQRAAGVLRNLRNMLSRSETVRSDENLNALIEETARFLVPELKLNNVSLQLTLTPGIPSLLIDPVQIQQVIVNIILNSIEAIVAAGSQRRRISVATHYDDEDVTVSIADTGTGIDPSLAASLFDPFRTTRGDGLGLGLAICRSILAGHHGRIWADPPGDGGATFRFTLPRNSE